MVYNSIRYKAQNAISNFIMRMKRKYIPQYLYIVRNAANKAQYNIMYTYIYIYIYIQIHIIYRYYMYVDR